MDAFVQALCDEGWVEPFEKLLTLHARKDRFCDGHLLEMLKSRHIQAILRRLAALHA